MKKLLLSALMCIFFGATLLAQVTTVPAIIQKGYKGEITIIYNPNGGNKGMVGATQCYAHTGISYNGKDWQQTGEWRDMKPKYKMTKNADGNWELKITPDIYTYYGVAETTDITRICIVFNDGKIGGKDGTKEGKTASGGDFYIDLQEKGLAVVWDVNVPEVTTQNEEITFMCHASEKATLTLSLNGQVIKSVADTIAMECSLQLVDIGNNTIELKGEADGVTKTLTTTTYVAQSAVQAKRPDGIEMGIYYREDDPTQVTLCTFAAANKVKDKPSVLIPAQHVYVVGDFNNWTISEQYQLKQDSAWFWITLNNLIPQREYAFQYIVVRADGRVVRISDLFSEKVLHPDDKYEPKTLNPQLKPYPIKADGSYVTVFQTNQERYQWSDATLNFKRPNKNNLIIYELWVYDHTLDKSIQGLMGQLDYLTELGVNCIELMPVNEFDGNQSWGYSPNHYFALDKAYGSPNDLKIFVDSCHARGMAVVLDMVFNHATGLNPMNKLYPYGEDLHYNPWFNFSAPHPDNVYEDWNHDFEPTHRMVIRALEYWMDEYKVDGYRLDLSHGLCGKGSSALSNLMDYYHQAVEPRGGYMMLEHWGNSMGTDRPKLVEAGMMCWQNTTTPFQQTAMGWLKSGDGLSDANKDGYVSYCENHDEERCFFKAKQFGNGDDIKKNEITRVRRVPLNLGFQCMLNGPQLFYHYAELGYDFSKFQNASGAWGKDGKDAYGTEVSKTFATSEYKMTPKANPEKLGWMDSTNIRMSACRMVGQIIRLRTQLLPTVFEGNPTKSVLTTGKALRTIQWGNDVFVAGNFSVSQTQTVTLPEGEWYDYLHGGLAASTYKLRPGTIYVFTAHPFTEPHTLTTEGKKTFINGTIYIEKNGKWYNILGATMPDPVW